MAEQDTTEILCGLTDYVNHIPTPSAERQPPYGTGSDGNPPRAALRFRCSLENMFSYAHQEARQHALFEINASDSTEYGLGRSPLNICLCLDRSGSMEGDPLSYAKKACAHIVDLLGPDDVLSVITFAERGEILFASQKVRDKDELKAAIGRISVGNRTNLYQGLESAIEQVLAGKSPTSINRILLLSDGEPTAGNKEFQSIVTLVTDRKREGVKVTALGFGPDYNEELIAALARRTGGNYYYITRAELLPEVFRIEMDSLMQTVAREIKMRVNLTRGVAVKQVYGNDFQPAGARTYEVNLVDVAREGAVTSLWEFSLTPHPAGVFRLGTAEIEYENCYSRVREVATTDITVEFTRNPNRLAAGVNPRVQGEIQIMLAARSLDRTMLEMRKNGTGTNSILPDLERTQQLLVQHGRTDQADQIEKALVTMRDGGSKRSISSAEKTLIGAIVQLDQGKRA